MNQAGNIAPEEPVAIFSPRVSPSATSIGDYANPGPGGLEVLGRQRYPAFCGPTFLNELMQPFHALDHFEEKPPIRMGQPQSGPSSRPNKYEEEGPAK